MQRQSLGSPSSKLHIHGGGGGGGGGAKEEILKAEKDLNQSQNDDEADHKSLKPLRSSSSPPDKLIHLIPLLMLFCFLLLYLFSHDPSHSELAQFDGFKKRSSKLTDSNEIADLERFVVKSDVFSIRSLRNLQEIGTYAPKSRLHRKMGDF
uniref:Uncharacterized protein n=1 Tax=Vitis vinifera TaxID=29760 RepID=A5BZQ4_VITVI|nr:hypothetical protein VITISV_028373 [Vitis vinifera]